MNNPTKKEGMTDGSGIRLYITEKMRPHSAGKNVYGPLLEIPVGVKDYEQSATCPSVCTRKMNNQPIYFVEFHVHMHFYGKFYIIIYYYR